MTVETFPQSESSDGAGAAARPEPQISHLAHVGIYVQDLDREVAFYRDVLRLHVTDRDPKLGLVFLSSRPDVEHHELLLAAGRDRPGDVAMVQQLSWRCSSLADVIGFHYKLKEHGVRLDMEVSHGIAIGIYFYDPEGNRNEVYWGTGLKATQPYLSSVDLEAPPEEIWRHIQSDVEAHGGASYVEPGFMEKQRLRHR